MNKIIVKVMCTLICSFLVISGVQAKGVFKFDKDLNEKGTVDSSRVILGNNVTSEEDVDGISIIAANNANIKGSAPYALYVGNVITIESKIEKDLVVLGNSANISSDAEINRDIYAFVSNMKINASGARNIRFVGDTLDIRGITINGNVYANANEVLVDKNTTIEGKITCFDYTVIEGKGEATIGKIVEKESSNIEKISLWQRILNAIKSSISLFVVLAILISVLPKFKTKLEKEPLKVEESLKTIAKGLFVLIAVPIIALFTLCTGILAPLSLIVISLYAIICYISSGIAAYIVINKLISKYSKNMSPYISLLISVVVIKLIDLIPYVGSFITILFLLYGVGFIYQLVKSRVKA